MKLVAKKDRLDKFLAKELNETRSQIIHLIKKGRVKVNGEVAKKGGVNIKDGDIIEVNITQEKSINEIKVDFDIQVLYEDENLLVINKPPGVVVHPASSYKGATLVDWLKSKNYSLSTIAGEERFGIVHRIDKETSGALIIAKDNKTHTFLSEQLKDKSMGRYYLAVLNMPLKEAKCVDAPIGRNPKDRKKMAIVKGAKDAKTLFVPIYDNIITAKLYSGRTHQIRVHLKSIGRYILGDEVYGKKDEKRVMLHARELYFIHPNGKKISIIAPLFDDFKKYIKEGDEKISNLSNYFVSYEWMCKS